MCSRLFCFGSRPEKWQKSCSSEKRNKGYPWWASKQKIINVMPSTSRNLHLPLWDNQLQKQLQSSLLKLLQQKHVSSYLFTFRACQGLVFGCCVWLSINTDIMHDLLLCWVFSIWTNEPCLKGTPGISHLMLTTSSNPGNESFTFSHFAGTHHEIPLTSHLTFHHSNWSFQLLP